jgi:hypothetical protein
MHHTVNMYNNSNHGSFQWPVITFELGPNGTFVPTNTNYRN